jgi:photosynthetic reaction center cytochrome c subunit
MSKRKIDFFPAYIGGALGAVALVFVASHFTRPVPRPQFVQLGYRGLAEEVSYLPSKLAATREANQVPPPADKVDPAGTPASATYQNVKVLGKVDSSEMLRLMSSIANWVSADQQCTYCHNPDNLAYDSIYTKIVARRMLQMTEHINRDWKQHVAGTGVTCYTCHRGQPVPTNVWFNAPLPQPNEADGVAEVNQGKNLVSKVAAYSALPYDPLTHFLEQANEIRVVPVVALPGTSNVSIKQTEWTYALMMQFSEALGVNCTYCHNTRAFWDYSQSRPQKATAWYGIRMVRDLNNNFMDPLGKSGIFPAARLGALGDAPKIQCSTCHKGVYKPLFGVSMVKDYPEIGADGQVDTTADIGKLNDYTDKK